MPDFRVGIVQFDPVVGDATGNAERIAREYDRAAGEGADLVVAPELSVLGYPPRDLLHRRGVLEAQDGAVDSLAERTVRGPPLVVGAAVASETTAGAPLHNGAVLLRDGDRAVTYHKRLLPTYDVFDEHRYFQAGEDPLVVDVDGVPVGLTVCEDAWHDAVVTGKRRHADDPIAETAAAGAEVVLTISASPFGLGKPGRRERRFRDHADRTGCPVVLVNQVGANDELVFDGNSLVATPAGITERLAAFESETGVVALGDDNGDGAATPPAEDYDTGVQARAALTLGVRDYFDKTGFDEAVVGLSGGIDSSVTVALAADALGPEAVYGLSLPSAVTSEESVADARAVAGSLGVEFDVVPIESAVAAIHDDLAAHAQAVGGVAAENLQARVRGDVLMGIANERDALVLTPDNKSEAAVGYCTLYGDAVGALAPLGDCYKRVVYRLADEFNERPPDGAASAPIPESVVEKPPTAELRADQTDADDLPPYDELDPVLADYVEGTDTGAGLRDRHPEAVVDEALARVTRSEFKRRQTPPPLRITEKALGRGWNYPIAASYEHVHERE